MNDIIPWKCHICSREFDTHRGGICFKCNRVTCKRHLRRIKNKDKKLKGSSDQIQYICVNCITQKSNNLP